MVRHLKQTPDHKAQTSFLNDHQLLLEALRDSRSGKARQVMDGHILACGDHLIETLQERGVWERASYALAPARTATSLPPGSVNQRT
jgi:DNA-binding GntR family transcriptional regulator